MAVGSCYNSVRGIISLAAWHEGSLGFVFFVHRARVSLWPGW